MKVKNWLQKHPRIYSKISQQVLNSKMIPDQAVSPVQSVHVKSMKTEVEQTITEQSFTEESFTEESELKLQITEASERWTVGRRLDV